MCETLNWADNGDGQKAHSSGRILIPRYMIGWIDTALWYKRKPLRNSMAIEMARWVKTFSTKPKHLSLVSAGGLCCPLFMVHCLIWHLQSPLRLCGEFHCQFNVSVRMFPKRLSWGRTHPECGQHHLINWRLITIKGRKPKNTQIHLSPLPISPRSKETRSPSCIPPLPPQSHPCVFTTTVDCVYLNSKPVCISWSSLPGILS